MGADNFFINVCIILSYYTLKKVSFLISFL